MIGQKGIGLGLLEKLGGTKYDHNVKPPHYFLQSRAHSPSRKNSNSVQNSL